MEFNLASIAAAVAAAIPDRPYFTQGGVRLSYGEFMGRSHQLANGLARRGLGCRTERAHLAGHESGQDHVAVYMFNCHEYLEVMIACYAARAAPFNVNYRYVDDELVYLLDDQQASAVVYQSEFAPVLDRIRGRLPMLRTLIQVADDSPNALLEGADWYHDVLAAESTEPPDLSPSPDDLYVLCTGGTTGMPKGVLWRQADIFVSALSGASTRLGREFASTDEIVQEAIDRGERFRNLATAPFMHGAAQWSALTALTHGNGIVLPGKVHSLDPAEVWRTASQERVTMMQIVGDAFARPLLDELERHRYDLRSLKIIMNGGANLSVAAKRRILEHLPHVTVGDGLGTSEAGATGVATSKVEHERASAFDLSPGVTVLSSDLSRAVEPGERELGWMATGGRIPLGYLGDPGKTASTFPTINGVRYVIPGDRAELLADGRMVLRGRDSVTINSGGEKIFAEEVEQALLAHEAIEDVVVCGRPSERWGSEVVAVVALRPGQTATSDELCAAARIRIAPYKVPKLIVFRDRIARHPSGKADYRWATDQTAIE